MRIFFAVSVTSRQHTDFLREVGAQNRLSSFWYMKTEPFANFRYYLAKGTFPPSTKLLKRSEVAGKALNTTDTSIAKLQDGE